MAAAVLKPVPERESVQRWRLEQLATVGYPADHAKTLSKREDVDLHLAIRLLRQGCPVETALQILL
jgi:hypothetical protein